MEVLTYCDHCEEFKSDVMYRVDPDYTDEKGLLNMRLMCEECDEAPRHLTKEIEDQICDDCGEYNESTHLREDPWIDDVFNRKSISNLCDECHKEAHHDI